MKMIWCSILFLGFFSANGETICSFAPHGSISKEALPSDYSLTQIDFSYCNVTNIEDSAFSNSNQLSTLHLDDNSITELRRNAFVGLPNLEYLILDENQISSIEDGALNLPNLTLLSLRGNQLTKLSDTVFSQLPKLKFIDLSQNKLKHIGKSLNSLQNIYKIELNDNKIHDIDLKEFAKLPALDYLVLSNSGLDWTAQIVVSDDFVASVDSNLSRLDLSNTNIKSSSFINVLKAFKKLRVLVAESNPFEEITWNASSVHEAFPKLHWIGVNKVKLNCIHLENLRNEFEKNQIIFNYSNSECAA